jgi:CPA2 family monovalent cation:H+ antiporter-2
MDSLVYLRDLVIIVAVSVAVVAALSRIGIPPIAGFILAGVLVGPNSLGLINDVHQVEILAEVGVALLLFGIGLELSLERLRRLWTLVVFGGLLQVGLTAAVTFLIVYTTGNSWNTSLMIGFLVAVSSTAIVLRGLESRGEVDAPHGRFTLGILVFQDLMVVPMMLAIPLLGGGGTSAGEVVWALLKSLFVVVAVLILGRLALPRLFLLIARTRQRPLFVMTVLLVCVGTAWLASFAGVSLALGAFLAGLIVADSEYRHQALGDLIPFQDVFASLFFVSVGMLLDPRMIIANLGSVILILVLVLFGKSLLVMVSGLVMRLPLRVCVLAAVALSQIGEFSFVMARSANDAGLLVNPLGDNLLAAAILSMFITPFAMTAGPHIAAGVGRMRWFSHLHMVASAEECRPEVEGLKDHVIIGGYGFVGRELARAFRDSNIPYVICELNVDNVRSARQNGEPAYFGDVTSPEVLETLGVQHAKELVIVINDPTAVEQTIRAARSVAPHLHIIARTRYLLDVESLRAAGASEVVPAELEAGVEITSRVLGRHGVSPDQVVRRLRNFRASH